MNTDGIATYGLYGLILVVVCGLVMSAGCVTAGKNLYNGIVEKPTPIPTQETVTTIPTATPRPIETIWQYVEPDDLRVYRTGGHYLGEMFRFRRENATMQKDLEFTLSVYKAVLKDSYQWNDRKWGTNVWWTMYAPDGHKFLFVFVRLQEVGENVSQDARMWIPMPKQFAVQDGDNLIYPDPNHVPCTLIKDFETHYTVNDDAIVSDFGYYYKYTKVTDEGDDGTSECQEHSWLHMGKSNAVDGYIPYVVREDVNLEDLKVVAGLSGFGKAYWILTERPN